MAGAIETTFSTLLAEFSDLVLPIDDDAVKADLDSYGATFKRTRGPLPTAARADLLAGLVLLHAHHADLGPVLQRLSDAQTKRLADALGLDFAALGALATWPLLVAGRIVAQKLPGLTPKKRGAPPPLPPPSLGGQIQKPGAVPERPVTPPRDERRKRRATKTAAKAAAASSSDRSSGDSPDSALEVPEPPIPPRRADAGGARLRPHVRLPGGGRLRPQLGLHGRDGAGYPRGVHRLPLQGPAVAVQGIGRL